MTAPTSARTPGLRRWSVEHDGLTIGALDWGGDGPNLVLLHPNGFCAGLFEPLARRLVDDFRVIAVDLRGHGTSDAPTSEQACSVVGAASDVVAMLDHLGLDDVVVLGESLGGGAGILVDQQRPGLVRRLLLCEAIAAPSGTLGPPEGENRMAELARRRRVVWSDRATALTSFGSRPPLSVMEPDALAGYVQWGFRDRDDGQVELACPTDVEAWFFACGARADGAPAAFEHLSAVHAAVTVVRGERTNLPLDMFDAQAAVAGVALLTVPGTHFFVQEDSVRAADLVRELAR